MALAVISPKFQIVIPKEIRERMGLQPGQQVSLIDRGEIITWCRSSRCRSCEGSSAEPSLDDYRDETDRL